MDERDALQPTSTEEEARIGETCLFMNERGRLRVNPWCPERPLFEPLLFVLQLRGRPLQDKSGDRCSHCPDAMSVGPAASANIVSLTPQPKPCIRLDFDNSNLSTSLSNVRSESCGLALWCRDCQEALRSRRRDVKLARCFGTLRRRAGFEIVQDAF